VGCGNGVVEAGEGCDDGNLIREDGCTAYCQIAACGDGILREGVEECDDGNTETEVCRYGETSCSVCAPDCRSIAGATSYCGDRIVDAAEVCDDGNAYDTDACTRACLCGSGFHLEAGVCANNTRSCRVENATFARQTWNGSGYGPCTPVNCAPAFHVAADRCDPDEIACTAPNAASAVQRWDGSAYGECLVLGCADDYHLESGVCLSNRRACTLANATAATQGWNPDTLSYGGCEASTCAAGYRPQFGTCVAGYVQVDAGDQHVCAVLADGVVHCWGRNIEGQLGDGTTTSRTRPVRVVGLPPAVQVSVESASTCALTRTGVVFCWGTGIFGRTGVLASTPTTVPLPLAARSLSGGSSHHCAVLADQTPRCWGSSQQGQLGVVDGQLNTIVQPTTFADGTGVASVAQISAGYRHSCVIQTDGTGQCWGLNNYGQIGLGYSSGGTNNTRLPGEIVGLITGVEIAAGEYHTCARLAEGTVKCWGVGYAIGDGYNGNRAQPVGTVGLESAISIAAGSGFSCAVLDAGAPAARSVKCWGANNYGALGNGTIGSPALTPIDTLGLADPVAVTAGTNFACALESDATISCWGPNDYGQLGDGTTTQRLTPVAVQSATACGDGIVAPSEVCDTAQLSGRTCDSLGFGGGPIACLSDCSGYNTSSCVAASVCGDNAIGGSEVCDGSDLDGLDCLDFGFASGMLDCASDCSSFVDARCSFDVCGNGVKEPTEACDGTDFGGDSCLSRGFYTGGLLCSSDCTVNAWQCTNSTTAWQSKPYTTFPSGSGAISGVISRADPADGPARGSFYDVYRFDVTGSSVRATIRVNSPDFSPSVLVYRAGLDASIGSASAPSGADATVVLEGQRISPTIVGPLQRGAYYVVVSAAGIGVTGQYSVSVYQSTF
jgi:cysteine-rich repeat protein